MQIEIVYFAWVREHMGCGGERVEVDDTLITIADLLGWLAARSAQGAAAFGDRSKIRAAIDGVMVGPEARLAGAREISLFPPVTGG